MHLDFKYARVSKDAMRLEMSDLHARSDCVGNEHISPGIRTLPNDKLWASCSQESSSAAYALFAPPQRRIHVSVSVATCSTPSSINFVMLVVGAACRMYAL